MTLEWYIAAVPLYSDNRAATIYTVFNELRCNFFTKAVPGL